MNIKVITLNYGIQEIETICYKPHKAARKSSMYLGVEKALSLKISDFENKKYAERNLLVINNIQKIIDKCISDKIKIITSKTILDIICI